VAFPDLSALLSGDDIAIPTAPPPAPPLLDNCGDLVDAYKDPSLPDSQPMMSVDFIESCCTRGETTMEEFDECLNSVPKPPDICAEEPDSPVCTCFDEAGEIDEDCECGVMLDLYADPSSGLAALFVGDATDIEFCCTGGMTIGEASACLFGRIVGTYAPTSTPVNDGVFPVTMSSGPANLISCVDHTSGALKDECKCAGLVPFCSTGATQFSGIVPGLDEMCESIMSCCGEDGLTANVDYNACWEESGVAFPDLSALLSGDGIIGGGGNPVTATGTMPSCAEDSKEPYCVLISCMDPSTGGFDESCDCSVMIDLYTDPSSTMYMPMVGDVLGSCCPPGETSLSDAMECFDTLAFNDQEGASSEPGAITSAQTNSPTKDPLDDGNGVPSVPEANTSAPTTTSSTKDPLDDGNGVPSVPEANTSAPTTTSSTKDPLGGEDAAIPEILTPSPTPADDVLGVLDNG